MPVPTLEAAGAVKTAVEILLKPFALIFNPIAERIGHWLKRKPKLHIYAHPLTSVWCYAWDGSEKPMMQARFDADITNDSHDESVPILDGWIEGTKPQLPFLNRIEVPTTTTVQGEMVCVFVRPVLAEGGKEFTGRVVLLDQLKRKHLTDEITFTWAGGTVLTKPPTPSATPPNPA